MVIAGSGPATAAPAAAGSEASITVVDVAQITSSQPPRSAPARHVRARVTAPADGTPSTRDRHLGPADRARHDSRFRETDHPSSLLDKHILAVGPAGNSAIGGSPAVIAGSEPTTAAPATAGSEASTMAVDVAQITSIPPPCSARARGPGLSNPHALDA